MMNKTKATYTTLLLSLGILWLASFPSIAETEEDSAKVDRLIELEEMAARIRSNTYWRVVQTISETERAQKAIEECGDTELRMCQEVNEVYKKQNPGEEGLEGCLWRACLSDRAPFNRIFDKLYNEFLGEEINREIEQAQKRVDESDREELEETVRAMSI